MFTRLAQHMVHLLDCWYGHPRWACYQLGVIFGCGPRPTFLIRAPFDPLLCPTDLVPFLCPLLIGPSKLFIFIFRISIASVTSSSSGKSSRTVKLAFLPCLDGVWVVDIAGSFSDILCGMSLSATAPRFSRLGPSVLPPDGFPCFCPPAW